MALGRTNGCVWNAIRGVLETHGNKVLIRDSYDLYLGCN